MVRFPPTVCLMRAALPQTTMRTYFGRVRYYSSKCCFFIWLCQSLFQDHSSMCNIKTAMWWISPCSDTPGPYIRCLVVHLQCIATNHVFCCFMMLNVYIHIVYIPCVYIYIYTYIHHIYITYTSHIHRIYIAYYTSHIHHIYITYTSHIHHIHITYTSHMHHIYITYISHTYIHTYVHTYILTYLLTYITYITYIHTYVHTYIHTLHNIT